MADIIGRQISFPLRLNDRNEIAIIGGDAAIRQSIYLIIHTVPGERVMRPRFGCHIHELIFAPANDASAILAAQYVREALEIWEPRIELMKITAAPHITTTGAGSLMITITYRIKGNQDVRDLIYPYFLEPETNVTGGETWA
ncbi:GPW/gp25 family protein [Chloroflexota bacterium]